MRVFWLIILFLMCLSAGPVQAGKRVALVLGISQYQRVPQLANPAQDAELVAGLFKRAGFDAVVSRHDLNIADLRRAIREFSEIAADADIAVVYYAGHGIEVDGNNYLIPVDAKLLSDFDIEDETVSLDRVLRAVEPAKRLRLVILDACRDNPFARAMKRSVSTRSVGRGLAKIEPTISDTLIAFAARAGAVANDGDGSNSPFAVALVKHLAEPGLDLRIAFGRIRDDVLHNTANQQEPFVYGSLGGDTVALVPLVAKPVDPNIAARVDYELAAQVGTKDAWTSFLAAHRDGLYGDLARAQLDKLVAAEQSRAKADELRDKADRLAAQKADEFRKQLEEQSARQTAEAKQKLSEQAKKDLDEARRQIAEQAKKDLDAAREQAKVLQQQAEAAQAQVEEVRRQAAAEVQAQLQQARRDATQQQNAYELAAQVGTKEAWTSFLTEHQDGLYANLARAQLNKLLAAEQSRAKAEDLRAKAEELAAQKAEELRKQLEKQSARETAETKQKLSDQAKKDLDDARRQIAEQARKELDAAREQVKALQQQAEAARAQVEEVRRQAAADAQVQLEQARREPQQQKMAALSPTDNKAPEPPAGPAFMGQDDIARLLQAHLKRVGCSSGNIDGGWDEGWRKALELFNKNAHTSFDIKIASIDALDAVRGKASRVCPLECAKRQRAEGDRCIQIGCGSGFFLNSAGACEKRQEPPPRARTATHQELAPVRQTGGGGKCFTFGGKNYCE